MSTHDDFQAAIEQMEEAVTTLAVMVRCLRRLERDLWPESVELAGDDAGQT